MRRFILVSIAACFYYSGLVGLSRWLMGRSGRHLIVVNYHQASTGDLRRHFLYLRRHYRIVHIEAALEELYAPRKSGQRSSDRRPLLAITFDDGYRDNYTHGYALASELQVPFTIYLIPGYLESGAYFWWVEGKRLVRRAQVSEAEIEGRRYQLSDAGDRRALAQLIDTRVRYTSTVAQREKFLTTARKALEVPAAVVEEELPYMPMTWEQVREMDASGWVSFGAHTVHHPILAYLTDPAEVQREIAECRAILEQQLGHPVRSFAYPVGQKQHVSEDIVRTVREAGYTWALTTWYGIDRPHSEPYLLPRVEVDADQHWLVVAAEAAGLWGFFSHLRWLPLVRKYLTNSR